MYKEFDGLGGNALEAKLSAADEIYSAGDRKILGDAVQLAHAWAAKTVHLLARPDDRTMRAVQGWFGARPRVIGNMDMAISIGDPNALGRIVAVLLDGFKKIAASLGSNRLVLSDEPIDRNSRKSEGKTGWDAFAFVDPDQERMNVVYPQGGMLAAGNGGKMWMAALTMIHEISHRVLLTEDHRADKHLTPNSGGISARCAIASADTWGYFCADLNGALPEQVRKAALT